MSVTLIVPADVKSRFTEFSATADAQIQTLIDDTECWFDLERWACFYTRAHCLYIAHLLTVDSRRAGGASGSTFPLASKGVDGVSAGYAVPTPGDMTESFLMSTSYGLEYLRILSVAKIPAATTV